MQDLNNLNQIKEQFHETPHEVIPDTSHHNVPALQRIITGEGNHPLNLDLTSFASNQINFLINVAANLQNQQNDPHPSNGRR